MFVSVFLHVFVDVGMHAYKYVCGCVMINTFFFKMSTNTSKLFINNIILFN